MHVYMSNIVYFEIATRVAYHSYPTLPGQMCMACISFKNTPLYLSVCVCARVVYVGVCMCVRACVCV